MTRMQLVLALASSPAAAAAAAAAAAEESKPVTTQVGNALRPAAEAYGKTVDKLVSKFFAGSKAPIADTENPGSTRARSQSRGAVHHEGTHPTQGHC